MRFSTTRAFGVPRTRHHRSRSSRSLSDLAAAVGGDAFDPAKATAAGSRRVASAQLLRDAGARALGQIHALLNPEQRGPLAYLIRTGVLAL